MNTVLVKRNNKSLQGALSRVNQDALEKLGLINPASVDFQSGAKECATLFKNWEPSDIVEVTVYKGEKVEVKDGKEINGIKKATFSVQDIRDLANIALRGTVAIQYLQPRGGAPNAPEKGEVTPL